MLGEFDAFYISLITTCIVVVAFSRLFFQQVKNNAEQKKWFWVVSWNIWLTVVILIVFLFIGETWYRFFVDTTDSFALNKITKRWGERYYKLNNLKARDNIDYPLKPSVGKHRYSFVGDSFTAGHGIKNVRDRFSNILREKLDAEVHIIAANGLETVDEYQLITKLNQVDQYEFDVIVLVYCLNDIAPFIPETNEIYGKIYEYDNQLSWFEKQSYFLNYWSFRVWAMNNEHIQNYGAFVSAAYKDQTWLKQVELIKSLVGMIRSKGWELRVVTFPFLHQFNQHYQFYDAHEKLGDLWTTLQVPNLDLLPVFIHHKAENLVVNKFDAHPNERANQIAANAIEHFLLKSE